ncbi:MAG: class I SAM-dependent methyltransferase [Magnetococcales bacterium]|nr:class I SAM-dependent methyltransferase [Magnetococcales bacterium]
MGKHHHPQHIFNPAKAEKLLDPKWRLIEDPLKLVQQMGVKAGLKVVDLGCGAGFFTKALLEAVTLHGEVAAVDLQKPVLEFFHKHIGERPNLTTIQADLCKTGLKSGQWDSVFIAFTMHEVKVADALQEIKRILKPGGKLLVLEWGVSDTCPENDSGKRAGPPDDHRLLHPTLLNHLQEAGFKAINRDELLGGCQYYIVAQSDRE